MGNWCGFENDTRYDVDVVDYDGTRRLDPDTYQGNYQPYGGTWHVNLVMKFPNGEENTVRFPGSDYNDRMHFMSVIFKDPINKYENQRRQEKREEQLEKERKREEERLRREEDQRKLEKQMQEELECREEETRKEHERQDAIHRQEQERAKKRQEQQRLVEEMRKEQARGKFEDQLSNEEGLGKSFLSWIRNSETEKVQETVHVQPYRPTFHSITPSSIARLSDTKLSEDYDSWSVSENLKTIIAMRMIRKLQRE